MAALQVGVLEAGVVLESKSIIDSMFFASSSSFISFRIQLTIRSTQGIDKIISSILFWISRFSFQS
jgi:hypothetical protein